MHNLLALLIVLDAMTTLALLTLGHPEANAPMAALMRRIGLAPALFITHGSALAAVLYFQPAGIATVVVSLLLGVVVANNIALLRN